MPITLDSTTLDPNFCWSDEYDWSPVGQARAYSLSGAMVLETTAKQSGRPITLANAWVTKAEVETLRALVITNGEMTLTLHDEREFDVRWDHDGPALTAVPVIEYADPADADFYEVTLKFLTV
ncbi:MAG: hypothetical protein EOM25_10640 [Deltaproteobacteria bacterium]|nr:hypothetical protein [Deltaproteobacteria bacterium]